MKALELSVSRVQMLLLSRYNYSEVILDSCVDSTHMKKTQAFVKLTRFFQRSFFSNNRFKSINTPHQTNDKKNKSTRIVIINLKQCGSYNKQLTPDRPPSAATTTIHDTAGHTTGGESLFLPNKLPKNLPLFLLALLVRLLNGGSIAETSRERASVTHERARTKHTCSKGREGVNRPHRTTRTHEGISGGLYNRRDSEGT